MTSLLLYLALFQPSLELQYGDAFNNALIDCRVTWFGIDFEIESKYHSVEGKQNPEDTDVLELEAAFLASKLYKLTRYEGYYREKILKWLHIHVKNLRPGAEREAIEYLFPDQIDLPRPEQLSREAVRRSSAVAYAYIQARGVIPCRTEYHLDRLREAITSFSRLPVHPFFSIANEGSFQMQCYFVRGDFTALRRSLDLRYAAAKLDPSSPKNVVAKAQNEMWEKHLKANGY